MKFTIILGAFLCASTSVMAQDHSSHTHTGSHHIHGESASAPITVMGDHTHRKGEWMLSYRPMFMHMDGNRDGTKNLNPLDISGDYPNVTGVGPTTLRIVPLKMDMQMHMLGAMYAPTDQITLMLMGNYIKKEMDHITYAMMNSDMEIGRFTTKTSGWGDTKLAALYKFYESSNQNFVVKAGLNLPTGSIKERGTILNPMGATQNIRLPYAMQLGSGTYDLEPALTYNGNNERLSWGVQYAAKIRLGENSQDYALGNKHSLNIWSGYRWNDWLANTLRISGEIEGDIRGQDSQISGPVQTANPDNYGGKNIEIGIGFELNGSGILRNQSIAGEFSAPFYQNLNGPHMERDYALSVGYKVRF
ncbi:MAG: transporter [Micavibrio sp.]|nr:transporter [Micavibrio sp.]